MSETKGDATSSDWTPLHALGPVHFGVNHRRVTVAIGEPWSAWRFAHDYIGPPDCPYMRRTFVQTPLGTVRLHRFLRSDDERAFHDHPWSFVTLILRGGYDDVVPCPECDGWGTLGLRRERDGDCVRCAGAGAIVGDRVRPGSIRLRRAHHLHRVVLHDGKPATTLVVSARKVRSWGFLHRGQWVPWRRYHETIGYPACADVER